MVEPFSIHKDDQKEEIVVYVACFSIHIYKQGNQLIVLKRLREHDHWAVQATQFPHGLVVSTLNVEAMPVVSTGSRDGLILRDWIISVGATGVDSLSLQVCNGSLGVSLSIDSGGTGMMEFYHEGRNVLIILERGMIAESAIDYGYEG